MYHKRFTWEPYATSERTATNKTINQQEQLEQTYHLTHQCFFSFTGKSPTRRQCKNLKMENSRIKFTILVSLIHKYKLTVWLCHEPSIIRVFNVHRHVYYHLPLGSDNHFCGVGLRGIREWNVSCIILRQGELFVSNETFLSWIPIPKNTRYLRRIKAKLRTLELAFGYNLDNSLIL